MSKAYKTFFYVCGICAHAVVCGVWCDAAWRRLRGESRHAGGLCQTDDYAQRSVRAKVRRCVHRVADDRLRQLSRSASACHRFVAVATFSRR